MLENSISKNTTAPFVLFNWRATQTIQIFQNLGQNTSIKALHLVITNEDQQKESMKALFNGLTSNKSITSLNLSTTYRTQSDFRRILKSLSKNDHLALQQLEFSGCSISEGFGKNMEVILEKASNLQKVEILSADAPVTDLGAYYLAEGIAKSKSLKILLLEKQFTMTTAQFQGTFHCPTEKPVPYPNHSNCGWHPAKYLANQIYIV